MRQGYYIACTWMVLLGGFYLWYKLRQDDVMATWDVILNSNRALSTQVSFMSVFMSVLQYRAISDFYLNVPLCQFRGLAPDYQT